MFCITLPAGYTPGAVEKSENISPEDPQMQIYVKKPTGDAKPDSTFELSWFPKRNAGEAITIAANMESSYTSGKGDKSKGKFAGGKGAYIIFARDYDEKSHQLDSVLQGNKHSFNCEASNHDAPIDPAIIEACKSLIATD